MNVERMRSRLHDFDFRRLLVGELGWNHSRHGPIRVSVEDHDFDVTPVAEKRGFVVWRCEAAAGADGRHPAIPGHAIRRRVERKITAHAYEHLIVFTDGLKSEQVWQWVRREAGAREASREYTYRRGQTGEPLLQRLGKLAFGLHEEEGLTISLVAERVRGALDADKVTKRFYRDFQDQLRRFALDIEGIGEPNARSWYGSLMLNRLMFIYFIQCRGFLDGDRNYLRNMLKRVRQRRGPDRFHEFYRSFLRRLFHEGLGRPLETRPDEVRDLLGDVPYLNGGIFDVHELERANPAIQIPDRAFRRLFDMFDGYAWHLDERARVRDNEINPDVLGHIFEKSINQKQMGAYYTQEDITGYMAENAIVPGLLDLLMRPGDSATPPPPNTIASLICQDPDRYIRPALGHGLAWDARDIENPVRIDPHMELPSKVQDELSRPAGRIPLDQPCAHSVYAHPGETWRQVQARRARYARTRRALASGEVRGGDDLVSLNLNGRRLLLDGIAGTENPLQLERFWTAVTQLKVLDPTCGSGAFLFAALKVLEPIYHACLMQMRTHRPPDSERILARLSRHPNQRYFVLKSIVINNLYGVDIMKEATEICKLRLFLKLVAQLDSRDEVEPLPDIDFNIRAGNALVGFSTLAELRDALERDLVQQLALPDIVARTRAAAASFREFREIQTRAGGGERDAPEQAVQLGKAKQAVRLSIRELRRELDRHLAGECNVALDEPGAFEDWRGRHQPFHWCAEFYEVVEEGCGFDVVIGNPPYIPMKKVRGEYTLDSGCRTSSCPDIYAPVVERSVAVTRPGGRLGMITPMSLAFGAKYQPLRDVLHSRCGALWYSSFDRSPAKLFVSDTGQIRYSILLGRMHDANHTDRDPKCHTTRFHRWFVSERPLLFPLLSYSPFSPGCWGGAVPKLESARLISAMESLLRSPYRLRADETAVGGRELHFKNTAPGQWLAFCIKRPPVTDTEGKPLEHTQYTSLRFPDRGVRDVAMGLLNGRLLFLWWIAVGDGFHLTKGNVRDAPLGPGVLGPEEWEVVRSLIPNLTAAMAKHSTRRLNAGRWIGNYNLALCRDVTDPADKAVLAALGLEDLWDEVLLEYSAVVRTQYDESTHG